jgi:hypothetical protein
MRDAAIRRRTRRRRLDARRLALAAHSVAVASVASFASLSPFAPFAAAAAVNWTSTAGGTWSDPANWNSGAGPVPGGGDSAVFAIASTYTTTLDVNPLAGGLLVSSGDVSLATGSAAARTWATGSATIGTGGSLTLSASSPGAIAMSTTSLFVPSGGTFKINGGHDVTNTGTLDIGYTTMSPSAVATLVVDGAGSTLTTTNLTRIANTGIANITFSNDAVGSFRDTFTYGVNNSFTDATFNVTSGADTTFDGYLQWGTGGVHASQLFALGVTGAGSTLTQFHGYLDVGTSTAGAASTATMTVGNGGAITTSDGGYSVGIHRTGTVQIDAGGTINFRGDILVDAGTLKRTDATGVMNWTDTRTRSLNVQAGGKFDFAGPVTFSHSPSGTFTTTVSVKDPNSKLLTSGLLTVDGKATLNVTAGGTASPASLALTSGGFGAVGTAIISGAGASLAVTGTTVVGTTTNGSGGKLLIQNNAVATFGGNLSVVNASGTGMAVQVDSGADATAQGNVLVTPGPQGATFTVTGVGSTFTQTGTGTFSVGLPGPTAGAIVSVNSGGVMNVAPGGLSIYSGSIGSLGGTGTALNVLGNVTITGGGLGDFNWVPGKSMTIGPSAGSVSAYNSDLLNLAGNTISVSGNFSIFSCGKLGLSGGGSLTVASGARGVMKSLALGVDGTAGTISATNARIELQWALPNTIGAASGAGLATVDVGAASNLTITHYDATLAVNATGRINVNDAASFARLEGVTVNGGAINVTAGQLSTNASLAITNGGKIDLTDNTMVVRTGDVGTASGGAYTGVTGLVQRGRNGGAWNGTGIVTSVTDAAAASPLTTLAVATAQQANLVGTTYAGVTLAADDVVVMYTYAGDANLDGKLNGDDYFFIDSNVETPGAFGWRNGDFNYDGHIDGDDYFVIDSNIGRQGPPLGGFAASAGSAGSAASLAVAAVPEPSCVAVFGTISTAFLLRRRRTSPV